MTAEYNKTALLALPGIKEGSAEEIGLLSRSRPYLIEKIRESQRRSSPSPKDGYPNKQDCVKLVG